MKHTIKLLFALLICLSFGIQAQSVDTAKVTLMVGKSSDNTYTKGKEAEIIGTFPDSTGAKRNWQTNAFAELGIVTSESRWSLGLVAELHRNTLITKKQDVFQYGISIGKIFSHYNGAGTLASELPVTLTLKESHDDVAETKALQAIAGVTYNRLIGPPWLRTQTAFPAIGTVLGGVLQLSHNHNVGIAALGRDEEVLLGMLDLELNAYVLPSLSAKWTNRNNLFKAQVSYRGRTELLGSTGLDLNSFIDFQLGINYSFGANETHTIGIAYDWITGADPIAGLQDQSYESLTAKIKFTIQ